MATGSEESADLKPHFRSMTEADHQSPAIEQFFCGDEEWEAAIGAYLSSGQAWERHCQKKSKTLILLYCDGEKIVGYAFLEKQRLQPQPDSGEKIPSLFIARIGVNRDCQRQGHGTNMLEGIKSYADALQTKIVHLFVDARNTGAITLYKRFGFRYYTEPDGPYAQMILHLP